MAPLALLAGTKPPKPSFAKIAANGLKAAPPTQQHGDQHTDKVLDNRQASLEQADDTKPPTLGPIPEMASCGAANAQEPALNGTTNPEVYVQGVLSASTQTAGPPPTDGMLAAPPLDEASTQASSSSGSAKPPSLDGKSVASGTTFALDEKESLRPDDSASVMAAADEEDVPDSRNGSDDGMRAFRQQLNEISAMGPPGRRVLGAGYGIVGTTVPLDTLYVTSHPQETLYGPPQGVLATSDQPHALDIRAAESQPQPDPKLLEALESPRDRIWVLKLEQDIFDFVKDATEASLNLPQCNAYHRMLAHKIADYYMLGHMVDETASVRLFKTPNCRIPPPLTAITTPSTAASTPPPSAPQMKILRRGDGGLSNASGSSVPSKSTSENGESGTEDDKKKMPASREEREARYEAARLRIMGSAKPSESPETPKDIVESRSSSATGKRTKKKQRSDSEDGFEARSAYSAYYTTSYGVPSAFVGPSYGHEGYGENRGNVAGPQMYSTPTVPSAYVQQSPQSPRAAHWGQGYLQNVESQHWTQGPAMGYDLSSEFQRAMSFQKPASMAPTNMMPQQQPGLSPGYGAQSYGVAPAQQQHGWSQQAYPMQAAMPRGYSVPTQPPHNDRPLSSTGQPYQYGQLPSQAFPGRPPSNLEHPLPGSYKGKHFNPQSQAFVPTQQGVPGPRPLSQQPALPAQAQPHYPASQVMHSPHQRPQPLQGNSSGFSPHQHPHALSMSQPMMHPLPQPVFPRQPSPSMPLPPKPGMMAPRTMDQTGNTMPHHGQSQAQSTLAKWGTPASLPAKPPPSNFETPKAPHLQQQQSHNGTAAAARLPGGGATNTTPNHPAVVNGSGTATTRR